MIKDILDSKTPQFNVIMEILKLKNENAERGRNMLCVIDHVIDYYINRENDDLMIPVVYMPYSEEWAQRLCEEYVCIKLFLYSDSVYLRNLKAHVSANKNTYPSSENNNITKTQSRLAGEKCSFYQKLCPILEELSKFNTDLCQTSILYSKGVANDFSKYEKATRPNSRNYQEFKYWYLALFLRKMSDWSKGGATLCLDDLSPKGFTSTLKDNRKNENVSLTNIILFPTDNAGSFDKDCISSFQWARLNNYKQFYPSLRNVFIFSFSPKPYRLQRIFDFKKKLKDRMQIHNDKVLDFVSFTPGEVDNIFGRHCNTDRITTKNGSYQVKLEDVLSEKFILRRNEAALCVDNEMTKVYAQVLQTETECPEYVLNFVTEPLNNQIVDETLYRIQHFVYEKDVFVVLGYELNEQLVSKFRDWLLNKMGANNVTFGSYKDLKPGAAPYRNKIAEDRILIMSLRDHYTNTPFHRYPNSFDPYCVNPNQLVLQIVNNYAFGDNYQYGLYAYNKQLLKALDSPFRKKMLPVEVINITEPAKPRDDDYDMEVDRSNNRFVPLSVIYQDGAKRQYVRSEWMYYEFNGDKGISPLSDLMDIFADEAGLKIQPLSQFIDVIKESFLDKERDLKEEKRFREAPEFGLSQEEKDGDMELWKLLLKKKQDEKTPETVYSEIGLKDEISHNAYLRWTESDYGLQRSKALQKKVIVDYLKLDHIYLRYVRNIKRLSTNNAEETNSIIRKFLLQALLNSNISEVYSSLEDDAKELLYINDENDIKTIIDAVNKVKKIRQVKQISEI